MKKYLSYLNILGAAACWGCIGLFNRFLMRAGMGAANIVVIRNFGGLVLLTLIFALRERSVFHVKAKHLPIFFGTGVVSMVFFTLCYFKCQELCSLAVSAILLYTAPAMVVLMSAVVFRERITRKKLLALALALLGCSFVTGVWSGDASVTAVGVLFGLGAGFLYALYSIFAPFGLRHYTPFTVVYWTFVFGGLGSLFLLDAGEMRTVFADGRMILVALGLIVISTVLPYLLYTNGLAKVESGKASILAAVVLVVILFVVVVMLVLVLIIVVIVIVIMVVMAAAAHTVLIVMMVMMLVLFFLVLLGVLLIGLGSHGDQFCLEIVLGGLGLQDLLTGQGIPCGGHDGSSGVLLAQHGDRSGDLLLAGGLGAAQDDAACVADLVIIELTKVLHIHLDLVDIGHGDKAVQLHIQMLSHTLHSAGDIAQLAHTGGLNDDAVGVVLLHHLLQSGTEITHQRAADAACVQLVDLDAGLLQEAAVDADLTKLVLDQDHLLARKGFLDELLDQSRLAGTKEAGENIDIRHNAVCLFLFPKARKGRSAIRAAECWLKNLTLLL